MRKPRPFARKEEDFRDASLILVACDDTYAPQQYFGFFDNLLKRVRVVVKPHDTGVSYNTLDVLHLLLDSEHIEGDELWMILDIDHYTQGSHKRSFFQALDEARRQGVKIALSRPCFELWLLLHYVDSVQVAELSDAKEAEEMLRSDVAIGEYNKTNLKAGHYPLNRVVRACKLASSLDGSIQYEGYEPKHNTTQVFKIWRSAVRKAIESELPHALIEYKQWLLAGESK